MQTHVILAELTDHLPWLNLNFVLSVAAGLGGGLGVVGLIHFFLRPRVLAAAPAPKQEKEADPFIHGSGSEKRKSFRRKGNPVEVQVMNQDSREQAERGMVINRSVGGLCLQMPAPLPVDTQLSVRPTKAPHIAPWVQVIVKNCREGDIGYEVGCQFVKTPPWPVLMMFG